VWVLQTMENLHEQKGRGPKEKGAPA
jgi:hypothetical protein